MTKKVVIIGAGLAGLSAGIYLQKSGVESEIFELADWAGGVCTSWVRQGYRFDGCIHWMVGTKPGTDFNDLYLEVAALQPDTPIHNPESLQIEIKGTMYTIPLRFAQFKDFLVTLAPEDEKKLQIFFRDLESITNSKMPGGNPKNLAQALTMMKESKGFIAVMGKYISKNLSQFVENFSNPTLKALFYSLMPGDFSMAAFMMMLGTRMGNNAGYPHGGSLELIKRMQAKYTALGGQIHFHSKVDKIIVENGNAVGIESKGTFITADNVIAACDAYDTLQNMLEGKYRHPQISAMLESAPLFDPLMIVSFGLDRKLNIPYSVSYEIPEGIEVAPGQISHGLSLRSFDFDPSAAPENCSSVMVMLSAPDEYWKQLRSEDLKEYKLKKQTVADSIAAAVDKRITGFAQSIKVTDVATPATYDRLVNVYKSSYEGFSPTPKALRMNLKKNIPGVNHLLLCGQWVTAGGGICTAISSGKEAAEIVLKEK
jgi:phytoene dehydrogenase-like protein